jgi:fatty acid desaturase
MDQHAVSHYARALRGALPSRTFEPEPRRLLWLALHIAIATAGIMTVARGPGLGVSLLLALVIGHSFACAGFVAHETLHGSVVRNRFARELVGWLAYLPFLFSPKVWTAWNNKLHHGNTGIEGVDPDAYSTLADYRQNRLLQVINPVTPGHGHWAGGLTLVFGLFGQGTKMMLRGRSALGFTAAEQRTVIAQVLASIAVWATVAILVGPLAFVFAFVIPFFIANMILTAYILTNHTISPLTEVNDPLLNSLSVTTPRAIEILHLSFGYHVEHHVFPAMSPRHARLVRDALRERWPDRYQSLPMSVALWRIFTSYRVYKDAWTLIDPRSGREFPTLAPRMPIVAHEAKPSPAS